MFYLSTYKEYDDVTNIRLIIYSMMNYMLHFRLQSLSLNFSTFINLLLNFSLINFTVEHSSNFQNYVHFTLIPIECQLLWYHQ